MHDGHFFAFPLLTLAPAPPTKLDGRNFPDALATNCAMQPGATMHNVYNQELQPTLQPTLQCNQELQCTMCTLYVQPCSPVGKNTTLCLLSFRAKMSLSE